MAQVTVSVNGRKFKMGCREGEETRVLDLAAEIDACVQQIKGDVRLVQDERLFLIAAIILADQLRDTREELENSLKQNAGSRTFRSREGKVAAKRVNASKTISFAECPASGGL